MQAYSDPKREDNPHSLPDVEVFQLTAEEVAQQDEEMVYEYLERFPLATMNGQERDRMLSTMIEEQGITGGWFWWTCLPGCLPDSPAFGPFETAKEALADAQDGIDE